MGVSCTALSAARGHSKGSRRPQQTFSLSDSTVVFRLSTPFTNDDFRAVPRTDPTPSRGACKREGCRGTFLVLSSRNFSVTPMRINGGYDCIIKVCEAGTCAFTPQSVKPKVSRCPRLLPCYCYMPATQDLQEKNVRGNPDTLGL